MEVGAGGTWRLKIRNITHIQVAVLWYEISNRLSDFYPPGTEFERGDKNSDDNNNINQIYPRKRDGSGSRHSES
jgi:hypothetical protein